ncbi:Rho GTPase activating protein, putative [Hondaea fermentalgiana]|uniref:Rho GTPase activating protein, putative n=1 Tax=Hondaea fermentalgiana TaxID=2315210 RepID=A0A2R5GK46_9STRA|nr:Rho GTPase activating protein, putative [Hondaea fermentalgiana]|eukprot:GBG31247.1 Rho GTPase activating protein, putative [Hondaea fermentalgiana]
MQASPGAENASIEGCIPELVNALACTKWLGKYVEGALGVEDFEPGLFRVRAADSTLDRLKAIMKYPEGLPYQKVSLFVEENRASKGLAECANAISSLLKGFLRDLPKPLLPFTFCTEDLRKFALGESRDDDKRSEVGSNLAEDLMHTMVTFHAGCSNEVLSTAISLAGQIFALLCTVSRRRIFEMHSYDLFVPFLPSICGARDPMELIQEHKSIKRLNDERRAAEVDKREPPQTRLEVMILFGHRIWGYIKACMPDLDVAIDALRDFDKTNKAAKEGDSQTRRRKRDVIKRIFKPNSWFQDKDAKDKEKSSGKDKDASFSSTHTMSSTTSSAGTVTSSTADGSTSSPSSSFLLRHRKSSASAAMAAGALRMESSAVPKSSLEQLRVASTSGPPAAVAGPALTAPIPAPAPGAPGSSGATSKGKDAAKQPASTNPAAAQSPASPEYTVNTNKVFRANPELAAIKPSRVQSVRLRSSSPTHESQLAAAKLLDSPPASVPVPVPRQQSVPDISDAGVRTTAADIGRRVFRRATSAEPPLTSTEEAATDEEEDDDDDEEEEENHENIGDKEDRAAKPRGL